MGSWAVKRICIILAFIFVMSPVSASAAWDRLELGQNDEGAGSGSTSSSLYPFSTIQTRIKNYQATNSDVCGWLTVPGTNINMPIVHNSSQDNNYYVNRDWTGKLHQSNNWQSWTTTATYLDYRASQGSGWKNGTSRNLILYGHNWNNIVSPLKIGNLQGLDMFAQLPSFTSLDFAKKNTHIYYSTGDYEGVWRIFSVAYCELSTDFFYNNPNPDTEEYKKLLGEWKVRSLYDYDVELTTSDRIITLSTCTRIYPNAGERQRFVVVARLLREGESENDSVSVTVNSDYKKPRF